MSSIPDNTLYYRRARFSTRLPRDRFYVGSHYWLLPLEAGVLRLGLTRFATRMLGDLVEHGFEVQSGSAIEIGQSIGWIEGFKAVTDVFSPVSGEFVRGNQAIDRDPTLVDNHPYGRGWLYEIRGEADRDRLDVNGYVALLDATIDRMLEQGGPGETACPVPNT